MVDFNFLNSRRPEPADCEQCGTTFDQVKDKHTLCTECEYLEEHPEMAPKHWTWTRGPASNWMAVATWPDKEPLPEPGDRITIHRKDGSDSTHTVTEVDGVRYDSTGRGTLYCRIQ